MTSNQMPEACVSLMGKYATIIDFLNACNPSMQLQVCKDASSCFFSDFPTLSVIDRTYGERKSRAWLIPQLVDLSLCCGLKEDASREQLEFTATFIATDFHWLKTSELMLFFYRFKAGCYERFYSRFDPQAILSSLRIFIQERARAYEEYCKRNGLDPEHHRLGMLPENEDSQQHPISPT